MYYVAYWVTGFQWWDRCLTLRAAAARYVWVRSQYRDVAFRAY